MEINNIFRNISIEKASYKPQELKEFKDNPFIEALPNYFSPKDVIQRFTNYPVITEDERKLNKRLRHTIIQRAKDIVQPLPEHIKLENALSDLIRRGYLARNPLDKSYYERLRAINNLNNDNLKTINLNRFDEEMKYIRSTAESISVIGISGIGKTTAIERLLGMYPQIIQHEEYKGKPFSRTQIVWLKIDCPYDGNLSTLFKSFFKEIDELLNENFSNRFGYTNRITSAMMVNMTSLASIYGIGVLVIDEIQHLLNAKNNMDEVLNFIVTLSNTVGIPTVLIGTPKAQKIFRGNFRQARRASDSGSFIWDRLKKDSREWGMLLNTLWKFQCLKTKTELTEEIKDIFYNECQGITSVAVNLFVFAQLRAFNTDEEVITSRIIKDSAKEDLHMIQPMIKALKSNNTSEIMKYDDIIINYEDTVFNQFNNLELLETIKKASEDQREFIKFKRNYKINHIVAEMESTEAFSELKTKDLLNIVEKVVKKLPIDSEEKMIKQLSYKKAMEIIDNKNSQIRKNKENLEENEDTYESLKENGLIKNPLNEFLR